MKRIKRYENSRLCCVFTTKTRLERHCFFKSARKFFARKRIAEYEKTTKLHSHNSAKNVPYEAYICLKMQKYRSMSVCEAGIFFDGQLLFTMKKERCCLKNQIEVTVDYDHNFDDNIIRLFEVSCI